MDLTQKNKIGTTGLNILLIMWKAIKEILLKKACFHDWKLVKEDHFGLYYHYIYICQKCGEIKVIEIK